MSRISTQNENSTVPFIEKTSNLKPFSAILKLPFRRIPGFFRADLILLSSGVFFFFIVTGVIEEVIFKVYTGFKFSWFLSSFELLQFSMFAMIKLGHDRKLGLLKDEMTWAKAKNLLVISISMCASKGLTNMSFLYMNYPTLVIFKSLKLLSIMFVGYFVLHNKPNCKETSAACLLATSCVLFTLGDMDISPSFSFFGLVIVLLSLVGDAFHTNFQEKGLKNGVTVSEILMFSNFFAFLQTFVIAVWTREIAVGFEYCSHKPLIYLLITMRSLAIYLGAVCFMQLIKDFGSVLAATITTVRKIVSVLLSFAVVAKPFTFKYLYAGVFFVLGLGVDVSRRIK